jgi:DNA-binding NtrC family response regulator
MLSRLSGIYRPLKNWPRYSDKAGIWSRKELNPDKEPHSPMAHHDSTDSRATHQILGVDDDPSMRLLCVTSLTKAGYPVLQAEGSSEAMALYATSTTPIDLLPTDLFLPPPGFEILSRASQCPRVNGNDLVQQVLSVEKELRVLFMSSHTLSHMASQGIMIEPEQFLPEPFDVEDLLTRVAAALAAPPVARAPHTAPVSAKDIAWVD